ncbi:MAG: threonine/serine exporter family protein [Ruminococcaceae bacterium]|nr:threonine/serine exporter family protein [Oscillospiraceae bacterium]
MEYSKLLDLASDLGYELAMSGAETFRVEESISRVLKAYDIDAEVFVIPNCMHISIEPVPGRPLTRMRRIGQHGNDLDAVERFSGLSRRICAECPAPEIAAAWLKESRESRRYYSIAGYLAGNFLGGFGFAFLFGGGLRDALCAGVCGILIGLINKFMDRVGANQFFRIIAAAFIMALPAYALGSAGIIYNPDAAVIGALMILVPGLLFTNAMRDIIYGDTNSGINRVVQVLLVAMAIALGTAAAWNVSFHLFGSYTAAPAISMPLWFHAIVSFVGCVGFFILFNIHGPGGLLCALGGTLTWIVYLLVKQWTGHDLIAYFCATLFSAFYAETMARIRKYPAISYLVVSIFPLIPGAGAYFTMNYAVKGQMDAFASQGIHTAAIAGVMAVAILLASTTVRIITTLRRKTKKV